VGKDSIDASVGLTFSLKLFHHYRKSGVLQANMRHVPDVPGRCKAYLQLRDGVVVACFVDDRRGQRHHLPPDILCQVDDERGPFEWSFQPEAAPASSVTSSEASPLFEQPTMPVQTPTSQSAPMSPQDGEIFSPSMQDSAVPTMIAPLDWARLSHWTPQERQLLYTVLQAIDGKQTIQNIKANLPLMPQLIDESLHILLALNVVTLSS